MAIWDQKWGRNVVQKRVSKAHPGLLRGGHTTVLRLFELVVTPWPSQNPQKPGRWAIRGPKEGQNSGLSLGSPWLTLFESDAQRPFGNMLSPPPPHVRRVGRGPRGGGGGWHKASVSICLPLAAPIGLSPLLILTLCGPERVLVVSTEPPDDLSCLTTPGVGRPGRGGGGGQSSHKPYICMRLCVGGVGGGG